MSETKPTLQQQQASELLVSTKGYHSTDTTTYYVDSHQRYHRVKGAAFSYAWRHGGSHYLWGIWYMEHEHAAHSNVLLEMAKEGDVQGILNYKAYLVIIHEQNTAE